MGVLPSLRDRGLQIGHMGGENNEESILLCFLSFILSRTIFNPSRD